MLLGVKLLLELRSPLLEPALLVGQDAVGDAAHLCFFDALVPNLLKFQLSCKRKKKKDGRHPFTRVSSLAAQKGYGKARKKTRGGGRGTRTASSLLCCARLVRESRAAVLCASTPALPARAPGAVASGGHAACW